MRDVTKMPTNQPAVTLESVPREIGRHRLLVTTRLAHTPVYGRITGLASLFPDPVSSTWPLSQYIYTVNARHVAST